MEKAVQLADKIVKEIEEYSLNYTTNEGKIATTNVALQKLNTIIEDGFVLYKYLVEKKLYEKYATLTPLLNSVAESIKKLQVTEQNAKKLNLSSATQIWQQAKISIALLACEILDLNDENE